MGSETKHSAKVKIVTRESPPSAKEHMRPTKTQILVPPTQSLPNGKKPNFGKSTKQRREPRERTSKTGHEDDKATMVTVNIDAFLHDKAPKKKSCKYKKKKTRQYQDRAAASIDSKPHVAGHTAFAGASFTTDIPHEAALPKPSFV
ncbi:AQG_2a_G0015120.mRNA.1.CDS.1 [Saccharomyces cerevisiae]|uniref:Enhancer of mRNA-decapping protein 2 n=8 Tax=Saccharomyces TaxID=4930 RepID=EDC2_YEAST|nr:Edc2p [Saccharomyces cerevisiae S288C]P40023.1 RecName: Full=Enhancer of mRNA-decapping protein 2 [Saccharomyces cerevisiae S288C]AAB64570.1 Yer035wp [Saccharomyces cerevisiae]AHY75588.1 Edc2p [Saccharomyces cerevisiae YJM993]AJP38301.1 Edc2p [Saccharomyces cerevisiae YJM1078]AJU39992.1 Edc2p [Saccharomyces cerevisiae YJM693]AJU40246.1 Edc2p [Saccharomyces cerevisiae YJM969]AJU40501.1 Edc2p [Saccharomyces cerevisiae YJM972]AJU40761.1 Edc2p [Saccharomyces cerevisiae YJM975]AJU41019.1 Edc|eukprot:NP_010952.3 Edc2p [Saccharomyces cerevisiae S288C]